MIKSESVKCLVYPDDDPDLLLIDLIDIISSLVWYLSFEESFFLRVDLDGDLSIDFFFGS